MKILSVSSELSPYAKTGGLGEVCAALPAALAGRGHQVVTLCPAYGFMDVLGRTEARGSFWFWLFGKGHEVVYRVVEESDQLAHVFVSNPMFDRPELYGDDRGPYGDNLLRFALMSRAVMTVAEQVPIWGAPLGTFDVMHAHDWQAGLALAYHEALYKPLGLHVGTRRVMTIHNAAHQGQFGLETFGGLDLAPRHLSALSQGGQLNLLKAGLEFAHVITAVSPTFANELCTVEGGFGLHGLLEWRRRRGELVGILNGIDTESWDPAGDAALPVRYDIDAMGGKAVCKAALQRELGLEVRAEVPVYGMVSRLDFQKGVDLLLDAARAMVSRDIQLVLVGSGDPAMEGALRWLAAEHPGMVASFIGFDGGLARRVFAGCDFMLVPSLFEPCGLTQLQAMRYGTIPIVRATGGLRDTVERWRPELGTGTGWLFEQPSGWELTQVMEQARRAWVDRPEWITALRHNGMAHDWSWDRAASSYERIYRG